MAPPDAPHLVIKDTVGRNITFMSPALVEISKAKLSLDKIPEGAEEHFYYAFTSRVLSWLANTTASLPRVRIINKPNSSDPVPALIQPAWLDLNPQAKLTVQTYKYSSEEANAEDETQIAHADEDSDSDADPFDDEDEEFSEYVDGAYEPPSIPTIDIPSPIKIPKRKHRFPQRGALDNLFESPQITTPAAKPDPKPAKVEGKKRTMKTKFRVPDFITILYSMDPVTGFWGHRPVLSIENKRDRLSDKQYADLNRQVRKQARYMFKQFPELQTEIISTLSLVGGKFKWCDWKWDSGPRIQGSTEVQDLFVEYRVDGPDGTKFVYDDFAEDFKRMWKAFARRHHLQCNSFFQV
ncbi:hypothetical protein HGRIS_009228 [Hohenbuehelia grisea]|uniref:Uncharacterized protein n=1 Tax=Hohenbuehelia grisea TaxID=104357 RepID=A0ABR3J0I0_9AGAR